MWYSLANNVMEYHMSDTCSIDTPEGSYLGWELGHRGVGEALGDDCEGHSEARNEVSLEGTNTTTCDTQLTESTTLQHVTHN